MYYLEPYQPTSNKEISLFEARNNLQLPQDYRNFLLESNGGDFKPSSEVQVDSLQYENVYVFTLDKMFSVLEDKSSLTRSLQRINDYMRRESVSLPRDVLIIGEMQDGHHYIVINTTQELDEGVYVINNGQADRRIKIADSFNDFLNRIQYTPYTLPYKKKIDGQNL